MCLSSGQLSHLLSPLNNVLCEDNQLCGVAIGVTDDILHEGIRTAPEKLPEDTP